MLLGFWDGKRFVPIDFSLHREKGSNKKKRCRGLKATYTEFIAHYQGIKVKIFFIHHAGQLRWRMIVTTDLSLSFIRMMEIYSIRWSIEVFFKEAKQHLQLGKSQSRDFDAQITDIIVSMIQYQNS